MRICEIAGCCNPHLARGMCRLHYGRWHKTGATECTRVVIPTGGKCSVELCHRTARGRGLCHRHYKRLMKHGDVSHITIRKPKDLLLSIFARTEIKGDADCWEWGGPRYPGRFGYGKASSAKDGNVIVHRYVYSRLVADIPPGMLVLHRCDNPPCVNPAHLFLGTHQQNMDDMKAKGRSRSIHRLRGSSSKSAKLRDEDVIAIKKAFLRGGRNFALAREYGVHPDTIARIRRGIYWSHITVTGDDHVIRSGS